MQFKAQPMLLALVDPGSAAPPQWDPILSFLHHPPHPTGRSGCRP